LFDSLRACFLSACNCRFGSVVPTLLPIATGFLKFLVTSHPQRGSFRNHVVIVLANATSTLHLLHGQPVRYMAPVWNDHP
jgi:hypothetical protein